MEQVERVKQTGTTGTGGTDKSLYYLTTQAKEKARSYTDTIPYSFENRDAEIAFYRDLYF
jgi:hypothetical protein